MTQVARKILLPIFVLTELTESTGHESILIKLPAGSPNTAYFIRPKPTETVIKHGLSQARSNFNLFPIVLDADAVPWAEANIYLLARMQDSLNLVMSTYSSIADDLAAYRRFLDETQIDWTDFPKHKLSRPTYRYSGHLRLAVAAGAIAGSTAKRRMSAVISFYTWLNDEGVLIPNHAPWKASDRYIGLKDTRGFNFTKRVVTTDVSIRVLKQNDPYAGTIDDGGRLRPLSQEEQGWLVDALTSIGNTEMTLIHLFGLLTGARIQTILTFRLHHVLTEVENPSLFELRFPVGPSTGIDTKNDKQIVLHIPLWFYKILRTYAHSDRARRRRCIAEGGDVEDQYLFLSVRGAPLYQCKAESQNFDESSHLRHTKTGQGVRQFMTERVIPFIRDKYNAPKFHYKFHDIRASFGMNLTDIQLDRVNKGEVTLHQAREFVKTRMCHESSATTDLYLQYRNNLRFIRSVGAEYDNHLRCLAQHALEGLQ